MAKLCMPPVWLHTTTSRVFPPKPELFPAEVPGHTRSFLSEEGDEVADREAAIVIQGFEWVRFQSSCRYQPTGYNRAFTDRASRQYCIENPKRAGARRASAGGSRGRRAGDGRGSLGFWVSGSRAFLGIQSSTLTIL